MSVGAKANDERRIGGGENPVLYVSKGENRRGRF